MDTLTWIIGSGILMSGIALTGSITLLLKEETLQRLLLPMVAFAAGSLIGGAFFHMLPVAIAHDPDIPRVFLHASFGFLAFLLLEQFLHWHHCHRSMVDHKEPATYLILIADGLHNFLGGLAIGSVFLIDIQLGVTAWIAAAIHEVPQELGDFGILVKGGWKKGRALVFNFISGLTFLVGGLVAYLASTHWEIHTHSLIAFGAGNFIYIGASDLIPQINREKTIRLNLIHYGAFVSGLALLYLLTSYA